MSTRIIIAFLAVLVGTAGCDRPKKKQNQNLRKPASFRETMFTSITPTSDGGAYAVDLDFGVWYLRSSEAVKVRFSDVPTNRLDALDGLEITPLVDGGAYACSVIEGSLWYLREGTAVRVAEVSSLSSKPLSGQLSAFPLYVAERARRLKAGRELEDRPNPDYEPDSPY
jgi:hypothetical protein